MTPGPDPERDGAESEGSGRRAGAPRTGRYRVVGGDTADVAACAALEAACFAAPWSAAMIAGELESGGWILVARPRRSAPGSSPTASSAPCAYALLRPSLPDAELLRIAVHPSVRRRGCASALMAAAERRLRTEGARHLFLEVRSDNAAALALYRSLGFEPIGLRRRYYADGGDAQILRRTWPVDDGAAGSDADRR